MAIIITKYTDHYFGILRLQNFEFENFYDMYFSFLLHLLPNEAKKDLKQALSIYNATRGANRNPKFGNSEIVQIPIRYSDGQQLILFDDFG